MKKNYLVIFFILILAKSYSQGYIYGKEWINYSQKYYKIKLYKEGIYRIDSSALASAGIPLGSIDPRNFQVFIKGKEQFLHVQGENDGFFDGTDFIEFYGTRNDCSFDSSMYIGVNVVPNPYYSVLQDTAVAFLTWSASSPGKRYFIETDTAFSSYTPAKYFFNNSLLSYGDTYAEGKYNSVGAEDNRYDPTEGRVSGGGVWLSGVGVYTIPTPYPDSSGPAASIVTNILGESVDYSLSFSPLLDHHITVEWKDASGTSHLIADTVFFGFKNIRNTQSVNPSQLGSSTDVMVTSIAEPTYLNGNYTTPSFFSLWYPQLYNLNGAGTYHLYIPDEAAQSKTFADFSNFSHATGDSVKAFDLTNGKIVYPVMNGNNGKFILPNASGIKNVYITSSGSDIIVASLDKVNGNGAFVNYALQASDSAFLIVTHKKFISEANAYAAFRHSPAGGGYNTIVAAIDDLYDQFAYGIAKHPKSIRNFCKFLMDSSQYDPKYLFLIGKSTYGYYGLTNPNYYAKNLVPSYGFPPSDNMLTAGLNGTYLEPSIPTGRLAVTEGAEVLDYLDKIMQHDAAPIDIWQKNVMHFIGGFNQVQQTTFAGFMNNYKNIIEDTLFGANVTSYSKNTSSPIQALVPGDIINKVDSGVSLMTFYGHSSNGAFDININDPNVFNNYGKYPVFLANSCYAGDIHRADTSSLSEQYVFAKDKGAICFLASVSIGVAEYLKVFSEFFYRNAGSYNYGKGVGDMVKGAIVSTENFVQSIDSIERLTCMDMTLHGDPAVRMNLYTKPDYSIKNPDLTFDMTINTSSHIDSFKLSLKISNLARAVNHNLKVRIERTFPNSQKADYIKTIPAPHYQATVDFYIPIDLEKGIGLNTFEAWIDQPDSIDEIDNVINNHISGIPLVVNGRDIVPVYPYEFEIVPAASTIRLKASTANVFEPARNYVFEIDTTDVFNSPMKLSTVINSAGGTVEWNVTLPNISGGQDSVVYFWRVSRDSVPGPGNGYNWRESSFQMIANKYGWGQSHFFQFKKDKLRFVEYKRSLRHFDFVKSVNSIHVLDGFYSFFPIGGPGTLSDENVNFDYNSVLEHASSGAPNGWTFIVIDSTSGELQLNAPDPSNAPYGAQYGTCNFNVGEPAPFYDFGSFTFCGQPTAWRDSLMLRFLQDVSYGKYVVGYSNNYWRGENGYSPFPLFSDTVYSQALYNAFESLGVPSVIETMADTQTIVFMGRKGLGAGNAHVIISPNRATNVTFEDSITAHWKNGYITSPVIGPAKKWNSLHWHYREFEQVNSYDSVYIKVYGVTASGQEDSLAAYGESQMDVLNLSGVLPAINNYPFLRLVAVIKDDSLHTAPQMRKWQVLYDPIPEGAINPLSGYAILNAHDTVQAGDLFRVNIPFKNISEFSFKDTLVFSYWVEDAAHVSHPLPDRIKIPALLPDSVVIDSLALDVLNYPGLNSLWVEVNPIPNPKYQPEQYEFNNIARIPFGVSVDKINPILDVTFDGLHILNADIVSARPKILITVKDENHFLALNDTADFDVYITNPGSIVEKRIAFCFGCTGGIWDSINPGMSFTPAVLPNNSCKIEFNPVLISDGLYILHVKAKDRSNNQSGANDYKIQFEIVNKPTITHIMNYPNPFSTNTKFVFTLTGYEVPETFMIQVMTITGKVVREIKREELGFLHIGRNITEYSWDGKDDFGDPLANGTYLYRVTTRLNGSTMENRESGADKFFTKEIGKMVLIR